MYAQQSHRLNVIPSVARNLSSALNSRAFPNERPPQKAAATKAFPLVDIFKPLFLLCLSLFFIANLTGCQSAHAKRYPLQAEVISVDAPRKLIVVKHGEIPGLMPAMTMSYAVLDAKDIETLHPGDKITAELVVADQVGHLEKIALVNRAADTPPSPAAATK